MSTVQTEPNSPTRGATTEPDSSPEPSVEDIGQFARLVPVNRVARVAINATAAKSAYHHRQFIDEVFYDSRPTKCFNLSLAILPEFPQLGWRIGKGRESLKNLGVDLLLSMDGIEEDNEDDCVAGIHARFNWVKGAGGFFLIAVHHKGKKVMINGETFRADQRVIRPGNVIMIGECAFTLQFISRNSEDEDQFQVELAQFFERLHGREKPLILPTPNEHDSRFGDWIFQHPISRGSYGTVYMVIHSQTGLPAAAKRILKSKKNEYGVDREIRMAEKISTLKHARIASALEIHHIKARTNAELARIRSYLDDKWAPTADNITDEYIIITPLLNATFRSLYGSKVAAEGRTNFFMQLLEAVGFLHEHRICHRDIKPDNILVRSYDPPDSMLTDFGCASDSQRILYDRPGTIPYLAPEQVEKKTHGPAVDYWACGIIALELIRKKVISRRILPGQELEDHWAFLSQSSLPLGSVSKSMLVEDPDQRMDADQGLELLRAKGGILGKHKRRTSEESVA